MKIKLLNGGYDFAAHCVERVYMSIFLSAVAVVVSKFATSEYICPIGRAGPARCRVVP